MQKLQATQSYIDRDIIIRDLHILVSLQNIAKIRKEWRGHKQQIKKAYCIAVNHTLNPAR